MGLLISILFLPMCIALSLHWMSKRNEEKRKFMLEKEEIFSKHVNSSVIPIGKSTKAATVIIDEDKKAA